MSEHTISTVTAELVGHGVPRWDAPDQGGERPMPPRAWWMGPLQEGSDRGTLHVMGCCADREWQLEVGFCLDCGEVVDVRVIENYAACEVASLAFWPGLTVAIGYALAMVQLWEEECERAG